MVASSGVDETAIAADDDFAKRGCCCFWVPWPSSVRESKARERIRSAEGGRCPVRRWWTQGLRSVLKASESSRAAVGRRWRALVRRLRRSSGKHRCGFSYDAHSYARNFDEGQDASNHDDAQEFSSRFATAVFPSLRRPLVDLSTPSAGAAAL